MQATKRASQLIVLLTFAAACSASGSGASSGVTGGNGGSGGSGASASGGSSGTGSGGTGAITIDAGGGSGGGGSGDANCGSVELPSTAKTVDVPGNVLVIFDRSTSMNSDFTTPSGNKPKYVAAGDALIAAVTPLQGELTVGAILFPSSSGIALCSAVVDSIWTPTQINFKPGADFITAWQTYWTTHQLILGTPLNRAFDRADEALTASGLGGGIAVVVFTDGEPVCTDGMPAPQRAAQWLTKGIKTYVVGLPGAASSTLLNNIAVQGGTGAFLLPTDSTQLEQDLSTIAKSTITTAIDSCDVTLDPAPPNTSDVHLVVKDAASGQEYEVPRDDPNGWNLSPDGKSAHLVGKACADAESGRFSAVTFEFGCVDVPVLK